jgi:hypothetical protein
LKISLIILFTFLTFFAFGQGKKTYFPAWTFQQRNASIYGISAGLWNYSEKPKNTTTNGLRLSLIGEGILLPLLPQSPIADNDSLFQVFIKEPISERINGISLSGTGNAGEYSINGIALGTVGQLNKKVNGISAAAFVNCAQIHNGFQTAIFSNLCYKMNGIQIGLFNSSKKTRGIQIGLWNVNERRKFPVINWNFRD